MTEPEPWHLPHMQDRANDAALVQIEGFGCVVNGRPAAEMACAEPEPEPSLWNRLMRWASRPICNL
jgi:hypothetical protein